VLEIVGNSVADEPWGVFAMSKGTVAELRQHLRRFLVVELPDGERWKFRFYDPRILPIYLSHCEEWELRKFFGPVRGFGVPFEHAVAILQYQPGQGAELAHVRTDPNASLVWHIRPEQANALANCLA
jgi:hypothetical protein